MDSTPTKPAYRPLEIETPGPRRLGDDESSGEYGSSGTPGSPSKRGGPTLWTKNDDSDDEGVNGVDVDKENDASVLTQVTHATAAAAPVYGTASPMSFKRKKGGGGGGRGFLASLFCCGRQEAEDDPYSHRQAMTSNMPPHHLIPSGNPMHVGEPFLGPLDPSDVGKPCLVLDLDETLVHSSFKPVPDPDYVIPVEIDGNVTDVYVLKRPWVDYFMEEMGKIYEVVVFTASLAKYADPLLDLLDKGKVIKWRLFRESCYPFQGNYVKDMTCLGRPLEKSIIIDNSPHSYAFQPQNALPISSFIDDPNDNDLLDAIPYLQELANAEDVTRELVANRGYVPRRSFHSRNIPIPDRKFA